MFFPEPSTKSFHQAFETRWTQNICTNIDEHLCSCGIQAPAPVELRQMMQSHAGSCFGRSLGWLFVCFAIRETLTFRISMVPPKQLKKTCYHTGHMAPLLCLITCYYLFFPSGIQVINHVRWKNPSLLMAATQFCLWGNAVLTRYLKCLPIYLEMAKIHNLYRSGTLQTFKVE